DRVEDRAALLADLDPLGQRHPVLLAGRDPDVDGPERGDVQVVARERRRCAVPGPEPGGPQGDRGHVATHRAPDLPVAAERCPVGAVADRLDGGVVREVPHTGSVATRWAAGQARYAPSVASSSRSIMSAALRTP